MSFVPPPMAEMIANFKRLNRGHPPTKVKQIMVGLLLTRMFLSDKRRATPAIAVEMKQDAEKIVNEVHAEVLKGA